MEKIFKRGKTYYFRARINVNLQKYFENRTIYVRSLKTHNKNDAKLIVKYLSATLNYIQSSYMQLTQKKTIHTQSKQIQTLTQETQTQKTQIQKLVDDNLNLKNEKREKEDQIEKLIHIIKTITGFTGSTIKSIFKKFLPNDTTVNHNIDR